MDRIPPNSIELEESIIASCLTGNCDDAIDILSPDDFYKSANAKIFEAIKVLQSKRVQPDLPSVVEQLRVMDCLDVCGGAVYISSFLDEIPVASNIQHYANQVRGKAVLRGLLGRMNEIANDCYNPQSDAEQVIDEAQSMILGIDLKSSRDAIFRYRELASDAVDRYERLKNQKGSITGISTGYGLLDYLTCGFQNSDLIILAARPAMGKTALAINLAGTIAEKGNPVAIFSLEMSKQQIIDRQVAIESGVNLLKFRSGRFEKDDWVSITDAMGRIHEWPVFIDDTGALQHTEIRRRIRRMKKKYGIQIVFIDHLQLIRGEKSTNRDREIGSITAELKATAKEMDIPIILLSQLNRKLEERASDKKRPMISDLRDSGNIEQDSDIIMFLYRDEVYNKDEDNPNKGIAELEIAKQRNGPTGMIKLKWFERTTKFGELETRNIGG